MYRIGQFARLGGVSTKTLRFYDMIGLLRPTMTDPVTRYRYYAPHQLRDLAAIVAMKDLGLSLQEVRALSRASRRATLERAKTRLERELAHARDALTGIEAALKVEASVPVVVKRRSALLVASLGVETVGYDDVVLAEAELLDRIPTHARGQQRGVLWHQCGDAGVPRGEPFVEVTCARRDIRVRELPAATVACAYSADSVEAAEEAYDAIRAWMDERRYALAGPKRELNHGCGMLEIQFPVYVTPHE